MTDKKNIDDKNLENVSGGADLRSTRPVDPEPIPNPPGGGGGTGTGEIEQQPDGDKSSNLG